MLPFNRWVPNATFNENLDGAIRTYLYEETSYGGVHVGQPS